MHDIQGLHTWVFPAQTTSIRVWRRYKWLFSSDNWPHMITKTLTTNATYWLTLHEPIGKRSESISQDPNKYVKLYTALITDHTWLAKHLQLMLPIG